MEFTAKNIGIWGFGVVGKAAAHYLAQAGAQVEILDSRQLSEEEQHLIRDLKAIRSQQQDPAAVEAFLTRNDYIIVSPGVDTRVYTSFSHKFIAEFDLFQAAYTKTKITITGSVGKTTITHLLSHIIRSYNPKWWTGGNIGNSVLDVLASQDQTDGAIIEASSFQLDQCKTFAPDLAIITNIYPNHLDRHGSLENYIKAKAKIFAHQHEDQIVLLPLALKDTFDLSKVRSCIHYFSLNKPAQEVIQQLSNNSILFYTEDNHIKAYNAGKYITLIDIAILPTISFVENWLIICAVLFLFQLPVDNLQDIVAHARLPEHRLELVATINGIDLYNDSKGTSTAATLAAVEKLKARPIILILGGTGKGVDRTPFIKDLKSKVKAIICFGKERDTLAAACETYDIPHDTTETIEQALQASIARAQSGDQIVFSPAGASFDQFKNYEERGSRFKECVKNLQ
jgi:UDP-N-acetylmuramoylalanine--D-glutamate ligase